VIGILAQNAGVPITYGNVKQGVPEIEHGNIVSGIIGGDGDIIDNQVIKIVIQDFFQYFILQVQI